MANITYLLGAGASCGKAEHKGNERVWTTPFGGLPLVNDITIRLDAMLQGFDALHQNEKYNLADTREYHISTLERRESFEYLLISLNNLIYDLGRHASIDTLARKLYLINDPYLNEVKFFIDALFMFEQWIEGTDPRYDLFFASIFHKGGNSIIKPKNVKIITWNYDVQLELSLNNFFKFSKFSEIRKDCRIITAFDAILDSNHYLEGFSIFKLNGTSCPNDFLYEIDSFDGGRNLYDILNYLVAQYHHKIIMKKDIQNVRFSWESIDSNINIAIEICKQTDILVVIGYSFPTFNREMDKLLISNLYCYEPHAKKILVQCTPDKYKSIHTRISALTDMTSRGFPFKPQISFIDALDEFYVPFEFNG